MNPIDLQEKGIEALRLFNNAITTRRLYPPDAPQVVNAMDLGFDGIQQFLALFDDLVFGYAEETNHICSVPLAEKTLATFPNLVVFRQLRSLDLPLLRLDASLDRFSFTQVLTIFGATLKEIQEAGGGQKLVAALGLARYFPSAALYHGPSLQKMAPGSLKKTMAVRPELVACLMGEDKRPLVVDELLHKMARQEEAVEIISAAISNILQSIRKYGRLVPAPAFTLMLENSATMITASQQSEAMARLCSYLLGSLKDGALCALLSQKYPVGMGTGLYLQLANGLSVDRFATISSIYQAQLEKEKGVGRDPAQIDFLTKMHKRFLATDKGRQFLRAREAQEKLAAGEKKRKKKRLEAQLTTLLDGDLSVLKSEELLHHLSRSLVRMAGGNNRDYVPGLLKSMVSFAEKEKGISQGKVVTTLAAIGEGFQISGEEEFAELLFEPLLVLISKAEMDRQGVERCLTALLRYHSFFMAREKLELADKLLNTIYQMRSGKFAGLAPHQESIGRIQDNSIDRSKLPALLDACLEAPSDKIISARLLLQGPVAIRFLVDSLIEAEDREDRLKMLDLLTTVGPLLPAVVRERLPDHMPWYGKRNLIKLLSGSGAEEDAKAVYPYLTHADFRVQREAFLCILAVGGKQRKPLLLASLGDVSERLKIEIITAFADFCDGDIALHLGEILSEHSHFSDANKTRLVTAILGSLELCPCLEARDIVTEFLASRGTKEARSLPDEVWSAAKKAKEKLDSDLKSGRRKYLKSSFSPSDPLAKTSVQGGSVSGSELITGLSQEQTIRSLVAKKKIRAAATATLELIEKMVRLKNYSQAERLRDWLVEFDGGSFAKIITAGELIDRAKSGGLQGGHLEIWKDLYEILSTKEFDEVFEHLIHKIYQPGEIIVRQGALHNSLFFINSGSVKLFYGQQGQEVLLKTMDRGEIFGATVFFDPSIWTISAVSIGVSDISVLRADRTQDWEFSFPGLKDKLQQYCSRFTTITEILKERDQDRRNFERLAISGQVVAVILDNQGRSTGAEIAGELLDISRGGMAFAVNQESSLAKQHLWGRKVFCHLPKRLQVQGMDLSGDVIAVRDAPPRDGSKRCTFHIKFTQVLEVEELDQIFSPVS